MDTERGLSKEQVQIILDGVPSLHDLFDIDDLDTLFETIDTSEDGLVTLDEFIFCLSAQGHRVSERWGHSDIGSFGSFMGCTLNCLMLQSALHNRSYDVSHQQLAKRICPLHPLYLGTFTFQAEPADAEAIIQYNALIVKAWLSTRFPKLATVIEKREREREKVLSCALSPVFLVRVIELKDLWNGDESWIAEDKSDPWVECRMGHSSDTWQEKLWYCKEDPKYYHTKTLHNVERAVFEETFKPFLVPGHTEEGWECSFVVKERDVFDNDRIGRCSIPVDFKKVARSMEEAETIEVPLQGCKTTKLVAKIWKEQRQRKCFWQ